MFRIWQVLLELDKFLSLMTIQREDEAVGEMMGIVLM